MINKLYVVYGEGSDPYDNLALEKYLFDTVKDDELILYLWQNRRTVVCGRNQNIFKECRVSRLLEDGGFPTRRLSGGGAVFHDMGNLNFTFLCISENFSVDRQLSVIVRACEMLGIAAEKTGRNDVTVEMKKFSGNAFYSSGGRKYHHGTLMIDVDVELLSRYLNVDKEKLRSKGVDSVRSRVCNLSQYRPGLTAEELKERLVGALEEIYGLKAERMIPPADGKRKELREYFSSDKWLYGTVGDFAMRINRRFDWGDFDMNFNVEGALVTEAVIYSDANDADYIQRLSAALTGCAFNAARLGELAGSLAEGEQQRGMALDIARLLADEL